MVWLLSKRNKAFYMEVGKPRADGEGKPGIDKEELAGRIGLSEYFLVSIENGRRNFYCDAVANCPMPFARQPNSTDGGRRVPQM